LFSAQCLLPAAYFIFLPPAPAACLLWLLANRRCQSTLTENSFRFISNRLFLEGQHEYLQKISSLVVGHIG
jgi:hypothetical protein